MRYLLSLGALASLASCVRPEASRSPAEPDRIRVVGYLAGWGVQTKGTRIAELPGQQLTHINYAFALISDDGRMVHGDPCIDIGECAGNTSARPRALGGNFAQLRLLKARYPHLALLVAVGGWTGSGKFSDVALTDDARRSFVSSGILTFVRRWPGLIDGFDIDWEYPVSGGLPTNAKRPEDRRNFTLLLREFRNQLDAEGVRDGKRYLLTAATAAGAWALRGLEVDSITPLLDWYNVMTYDYHSGSKIAHFNSPLHAAPNDPTPQLNVDSTVAIYLRAGVPASKILIGIPFYGRGYSGVPIVNDGLFQPAAGPAPREWGGDYRTLMQRRPEENGFTRHWSAEAKVPWLFNPATGVWIGYDDSESVRAKAAFARDKHLGGVMIWELGGDDGSLLRAIQEGSRRSAQGSSANNGR